MRNLEEALKVPSVMLESDKRDAWIWLYLE